MLCVYLENMEKCLDDLPVMMRGFRSMENTECIFQFIFENYNFKGHTKTLIIKVSMSTFPWLQMSKGIC